MLAIRHSEDRGKASFGWLNSRHTFSFGHYHDPQQMGFGPLRVINEDRVKPGRGFDAHGHRDMEIISYVLDGALRHEDNMGNGSLIRPGDVQRMTAGTGVLHSEYNASSEDEVHFMQIWIVPDRAGLEPGYEQQAFPPLTRQNQLRLVGSTDGREGSVLIHQDLCMYAGLLDAGVALVHAFTPGRCGWLQLLRGEVVANGTALSVGDGLALRDMPTLELRAKTEAEVLLFDMV